MYLPNLPTYTGIKNIDTKSHRNFSSIAQFAIFTSVVLPLMGISTYVKSTPPPMKYGFQTLLPNLAPTPLIFIAFKLFRVSYEISYMYVGKFIGRLYFYDKIIKSSLNLRRTQVAWLSPSVLQSIAAILRIAFQCVAGTVLMLPITYITLESVK